MGQIYQALYLKKIQSFVSFRLQYSATLFYSNLTIKKNQLFLLPSLITIMTPYIRCLKKSTWKLRTPNPKPNWIREWNHNCPAFQEYSSRKFRIRILLETINTRSNWTHLIVFRENVVLICNQFLMLSVCELKLIIEKLPEMLNSIQLATFWNHRSYCKVSDWWNFDPTNWGWGRKIRCVLGIQ